MAVVIKPTAPTHSATIIFLHGLGDSGHGWAPVMRILARSLPFAKFILPHAPSRSVTLNAGMSMPAWYDIYSLDERDSREDDSGLMKSKETVHALIEAERAAGIPESRIVVGGFSQGGVMALLSGLATPYPLAGILSLSAYAPLRQKLPSIITEHGRSTPILMGHGTADFVVQYRWGQHSHTLLKDAGCKVTFKSYQNLDHSYNNLELEDIKEFLLSILPHNDDVSKQFL